MVWHDDPNSPGLTNLSAHHFFSNDEETIMVPKKLLTTFDDKFHPLRLPVPFKEKKTKDSINSTRTRT